MVSELMGIKDCEYVLNTDDIPSVKVLVFKFAIQISNLVDRLLSSGVIESTFGRSTGRGIVVANFVRRLLITISST